jgi:hypothetical protein
MGSMNQWAARAITVVVVVAAIGGTIALVASVPPKIGIAIVVFVVVFTGLATVSSWGAHVLAAVCASLLALLAWVALAVVTRLVLDLLSIEGRLPIWLGLVLAVGVFFGVALWYLHGDWLGGGDAAEGEDRGEARMLSIPSPQWGWLGATIVAGVLAVLVVIAPPLIYGLLQPEPQAVAKSQGVVSQIDVLIVSDRPREGAAADAPADTARSGQIAAFAHASAFDVRYSIGFATEDGVRWTRTGESDEEAALAALRDPDAPPLTPPAPLNDADRVLLLVVDGTPPVVDDPTTLESVPAVRGEIARWRRVARAAAPSGTTTYALLETLRARRLREWKASFIERGTYVRRGGVASVQGLASRAVTDAAVRLTVAAPSAQEDFTLALRHRPILRFDDDEVAPRPLSIEDLFDSGKVEQCSSQRAGGTLCEPVLSSRNLENGGTHLELPVPTTDELQKLAGDDEARLDGTGTGGTPAEPVTEGPAAPPPATPPPALPPSESRPLGDGSAIYVHPVPADSEDVSLLYLDYWWFLPYNPAGSGSGAFCGPGLVIPGISCFDHVSDWEGVTVVLDRTTPGLEPKPVAVQYAQHSSVVRYDWAALQKAWQENDTTRAILEETADDAPRPIVFVASGTHAAYPLPCPVKANCRQVVGGAEENAHDGGMPWAGNTSLTCGTASCLKMLPTSRGGRDPALWNAFEGAWGTRNCFLTYYCDSSSPPAAPGRQGRYQRPWEHDATRRPQP